MPFSFCVGRVIQVLSQDKAWHENLLLMTIVGDSFGSTAFGFKPNLTIF
jgi:hypothetical protein